MSGCISGCASRPAFLVVTPCLASCRLLRKLTMLKRALESRVTTFLELLRAPRSGSLAFGFLGLAECAKLQQPIASVKAGISSLRLEHGTQEIRTLLLSLGKLR